MRLSRGRGRIALALSVLAMGVVAGPAVAARSTARAAAQVKVTFTDSTFRLSNTNLQSGPTTFVVVNRGKHRHVFSIKGPGVKGAHSATLASGRTAKLTVTLRAGAYVLSDPVGLGVYNVQFLDVIKAVNVTATGTSSTVAPPAELPPMCGVGYNP